MVSVGLPVFIWMLVNNIQAVDGSSSSSFSSKMSALSPSPIQPSIASVLSSSIASLTSSTTSSNTSSSRNQGSRNEDKLNCPDSIKGVTIAVMHNPPYAFETQGSVRGVIVDYLTSSFRMCYFICPSLLEITWKVVDTSHELVEEIFSGRSDIILPITTRLVNNLSWPDYTGHPLKFNSIVKTSGRVLIVDKKHFNQKSREFMLEALLDTWPMFMYTFLLAGLSGICIWILESRRNSDEFESTFSKGWWQGFWWAFVSMTTVGYGDKTPKSVFGRVFGVIWILVGIVMIAMFTATATNALTLINSGIENKKVAVLASTGASLYAANKGAQPTEYNSFQEMYEALKSNQVEGIFIDKYMGAHYINEISDENLRVLTFIETTINYFIAVNAKIYKELTKTSCVLDILSHSSSDRVLQKYLSPIKIFSFNDDYEGFLSSSSEKAISLIYILLIILCSGLVIGFGLELVNKRYPQAFSHIRCNNKQHPNESAVERKGWRAGVLDPGSIGGRNPIFGSLGIRTQEEINQLTNANTRLKQLSDEIQSLRNTISLVLGLKPNEGMVEQGEMSCEGP